MAPALDSRYTDHHSLDSIPTTSKPALAAGRLCSPMPIRRMSTASYYCSCVASTTVVMPPRTQKSPVTVMLRG